MNNQHARKIDKRREIHAGAALTEKCILYNIVPNTYIGEIVVAGNLLTICCFDDFMQASEQRVIENIF